MDRHLVEGSCGKWFSMVLLTRRSPSGNGLHSLRRSLRSPLTWVRSVTSVASIFVEAGLRWSPAGFGFARRAFGGLRLGRGGFARRSLLLYLQAFFLAAISCGVSLCVDLRVICANYLCDLLLTVWAGSR